MKLTQETTETKPGVYTTEFWLTLITVLAGLIQQAAGVFNISDSLVLKLQFGLVSFYALARGIAKAGQPNFVNDDPGPVDPTPSLGSDMGDAGVPHVSPS